MKTPVAATAHPPAATDGRADESPRPPPENPPGPARRRWPRGSAWLALVAVGALIVAVAVLRPFGPSPPARVVAISFPYWNAGHGADVVVQRRGQLTEVSPWQYGLDAAGRIVSQVPSTDSGGTAASLRRLANAGIPVVPTLANITGGTWSYGPVAKMLHDPARRADHVEAIVDLVRDNGYAGIDIDYEDLLATDRGAFSAFVAELGKALHGAGKTLAVAVFAKADDAGYDARNVAQDYAAIAAAADQVRLMAYDFHWETSKPGPVAPISWVRQVVAYAKTRIPADKIVLGVPFYGYDWTVGSRAQPIGWLQAFRLARQHRATVGYDPRSQSPSFRYVDGAGRSHEVWFENEHSARAKFEAAAGAGIGGVYLWLFGYEDVGSWRQLAATLPVSGPP